MMPTALLFSSTDATTEFRLNSHCTDTTSFFFEKKLNAEDECGHFVAHGECRTSDGPFASRRLPT